MTQDELRNEIAKDAYLRLVCEAKAKGKDFDPEKVLQEAVEIAEGFMKANSKQPPMKQIRASAWIKVTNGIQSNSEI